MKQESPYKHQGQVLCICSLWPSRKDKNSATQLVQQIAARSKFSRLIVLAPHNVFKSRKIWLEEYQPKPLIFMSPMFFGLPMRGSGLVLLRHLINEALFAAFIFPVLLYLKARNRLDVIHFHGAYGHLFLAPLVRRLFRIPVILTSHGVSTDMALLRQKATFKKITGLALRKLDRIIVVGEPLRKVFSLLGVESSRIIKIQNGHNPNTCVPRLIAEIATRYRNKFIIVAVARMSVFKGIDTTLEALEKLNEKVGRDAWVYLHVGDGPDRKRLQSLTKRLGLEQNVEFLGHLPYEVAMSFMASGDLFVLPSWGEAFGIVYLEAMSRGVPAVGCKGAGAEECVVHGKTGFLVDAHDSEALAALVLKVIENPGFRKELADAAKEHAADFTWERNAKQYAQLYSELSEGDQFGP